MEQIIYSDQKRTATWKPGMVEIFSHATKKAMPTIQISKLICDSKIQPASAEAIKKSGQNPADFRALCRFGKSDIVCPVEVAEVIFQEAKQAEKAYRSEIDAIANLPQNRERREIDALFAKAERIANSDSDDNVWLPAQIRAEAGKKLAEWREKYPEAAQKEEAGKLMAKASDLRSNASGALFYDADGWLSRDDQQKRHDDFIKDAEALEARANGLK